MHACVLARAHARMHAYTHTRMHACTPGIRTYTWSMIDDAHTYKAAVDAAHPVPDYLGTTLLNDPARGCLVFEGNVGVYACVRVCVCV